MEIDSREQHRGRSDEVMSEMSHAASSFGTSFVGADKGAMEAAAPPHEVPLQLNFER